MNKITIKTKNGIFDCSGELLYKGRNNKAIYTKYPINANNKYVYIIKSNIDNQIRAFYKHEIKEILDENT